MEKPTHESDDNTEEARSNVCLECGATFKKPAYLKQHMQSHSLERPFVCSVDNCNASYRRKDHLTRHLLQHEGKMFKCPKESCSMEFAYQSSLKRHLKELHKDDAPSPTKNNCPTQHVCSEDGCGKTFKYASRLQKHEDSHVKLESVETVCGELGCMQYFSNRECLKAHIHSCHRYMNCEICGSKQLRKNIKRHLRTHDPDGPEKSFQCTYEGCSKVFSTISNLRKHEKVVHLDLKYFACCFPGCGMRFGYKHVRDNHEKRNHYYTCGDFEAEDEQFRLGERGGRKRMSATAVEMLIRKRITPLPKDLVEGF